MGGGRCAGAKTPTICRIYAVFTARIEVGRVCHEIGGHRGIAREPPIIAHPCRMPGRRRLLGERNLHQARRQGPDRRHHAHIPFLLEEMDESDEVTMRIALPAGQLAIQHVPEVGQPELVTVERITIVSRQRAEHDAFEIGMVPVRLGRARPMIDAFVIEAGIGGVANRIDAHSMIEHPPAQGEQLGIAAAQI